MSAEQQSSVSPAWSASDLKGNPHDVADKAKRVQRMFAAIARRYDLNNRLHSFGRDQTWRRSAVRLSGAGPSDIILDAACGTGDLSQAFAKAQVKAVTGVDFTEEMLEIARRKAVTKNHGKGPNPRYQWADVTSLPFDAEVFTIVSIAFGLRNVNDPFAALGEFFRVLVPGGRLVILEFSEPKNPVFRTVSRVFTERIMPLTATLISADRSGAYRYLPKSVATFADQQHLEEMIAAAGFGHIEHHPQTFGICTVYLGTKPGL